MRDNKKKVLLIRTNQTLYYSVIRFDVEDRLFIISLDSG
jgi:hypothetical protein